MTDGLLPNGRVCDASAVSPVKVGPVREPCYLYAVHDLKRQGTEGILLANPEISLYCPIIRFLVNQNKINNRTCMAGVYVRSDVGSEACFLPIYCKNYFCSIKYVKVTPFSMACCVEGTREPQPNVRRLPRLDGPRLQ